MDSKRLQELRAEHDNRTDTMDVEYCFHCGQDWPCDTRELALEAERLEAEAEVLADFVAATGVKLNAAVKEAERLRAALRKYGHHVACPSQYGGPNDTPKPCTCGFESALAGTEATS